MGDKAEIQKKIDDWPVPMRGYGCHACGKRFGGMTGYDLHRVGEFKYEHPDYGRSCMSAEDLKAEGYVENKGLWRKELSEEDKVKMAKVWAMRASATT